MRTVATLALAALLAALPAAAQDAAADKIKAQLRKSIPEAPVESVRRVPYGGLFEVHIGGEIYYTDEKASFMLIGSLVDLKTKENVTEARLRQLNKVSFDSLPLNNAIKIVRGNGSRRIAMFADPNCGYCKRFERELLGVNDITVYLFLYPILSADSLEKSKAVWCAPDRAKAWIDLMARDIPVQGPGTCATPIEKNVEYGREKRVNGTPTIFFEDGERVPGAMPIADFEKKLASAKPAKAASAN